MATAALRFAVVSVRDGRSVVPARDREQRGRQMRSIRLVLAAAVMVVAAAVSGADAPWPRQFSADGNQLLVNQPQLDAWPSYLSFNGRVAVVVTPKGGAATPG